MVEKEIEIEWNGKTEKVTIKRMTFGESQKFKKSFTRINGSGGQINTEVDLAEMHIGALLVCITKAPFAIDRPTIEGLDMELGEKLYQEIDAINTITPEKK